MAQNSTQTPLSRERSTTTLRLRALVETQQRIEIGERIRELRNASPETNRSIADYVNVGERSVANWIAGETGITYEHAKRVAELFEVDVRWLWDGKDRTATPDVLAELSQGPGLADLAEIVAQTSERVLEVAAGVERLEREVELLSRRLPPQAKSADQP